MNETDKSNDAAVSITTKDSDLYVEPLCVSLRIWLMDVYAKNKQFVEESRKSDIVCRMSDKRGWRTHCLEYDWKFNGPHPFVLQHGKGWRGQPLPSGYRLCKLRRCGFNSTRLALRRPDLVYVEGYALTDHYTYVGHSWVVDQAGNVIDVTWPNGSREYFGVPFRHDYVARVCATGPQHTLIERWPEGFPLLRKGVRTREWRETRFD
jgi:hypothetical protein